MKDFGKVNVAVKPHMYGIMPCAFKIGKILTPSVDKKKNPRRLRVNKNEHSIFHYVHF